MTLPSIKAAAANLKDRCFTALLACCSLLAPRYVASVLAQKRERYIPILTAVPSTILNNLAAATESTALVLSAASSDGLPRVLIIRSIQLDTGTSFADLVMNIYVGDSEEPMYQIDGTALAPTTANDCVSTAMCKTRILIGALQDCEVTFTNKTAVALGATASVRAMCSVYFPGDDEFAAYVEECERMNGGAGPGAGNCGCAVEG